MKTHDLYISNDVEPDNETVKGAMATAAALDARAAGGESIAAIDASFQGSGRYWLEAARPYSKAFAA